MAKLVGYKNFTSKKGKDYCVAEVVSEATERDKLNGLVGCKVEEVFLPEDKLNFFNPSHIGKEVKFDYELSGGRAYLVDVSIVNK